MELLDQILQKWAANSSLADITEILTAAQVPFNAVNSAPDILADAQFLARGMIERLDAGFAKAVPMAAVVPRLRRTPGRIRAPGPELGQDTDATLRECLAMTDEELSALRSSGVIA
jgi:formyl-CoA transferase